MKYLNQVEINQPLEKVSALFEDPANMSQWQPGFISLEHVSGTPGQAGARSKLKYKMGKRDVEMIETITHNNLPHEFHATYEAKGTYNVLRNFFTATAPGKTKWVSETEFTFSGMMKLIGWLMPGMFKKQSQKYLDLFKAFAEKESTN